MSITFFGFAGCWRMKECECMWRPARNPSRTPSGCGHGPCCGRLSATWPGGSISACDRELPTHSFSQFGNVRHVMASVPGIQGKVLFQWHDSELRVPECPLPFFGFHRAQDAHKAIVQRFQQCERDFQRRGLAVRQLRPAILHVRFDRRLVLGERQLETDVCVHVALRHMVDNLPHRPAAFAIWSFDLLWCQTLDRGAEAGGRLFDIIDELIALPLGRRAVVSKLSDGITWIAHFTSILRSELRRPKL